MTTGYPAIAAGVEVNPLKLLGGCLTAFTKSKKDIPFVGNRRASKLNFFNVPSMPRVRPRSLSAAKALKNEALTVVASEVMNLSFDESCVQGLSDSCEKTH